MKNLNIKKLEKELTQKLQKAIDEKDYNTIEDFKPTVMWTPEDCKFVNLNGLLMVNDPKYPEQTIRSLKNIIFHNLMSKMLNTKNLKQGLN